MRGENDVDREEEGDGAIWGQFAFRFTLPASHLCIQNEEYLQEFIQVVNYLVTY